MPKSGHAHIEDAERLAPYLLAWFDRERRALPWRETKDPYRIWVSEVMLQQTQVGTVIPHYRHFLREFPDLRALAAGEERDVLRAWEGLGYYARARNLLAAARVVMGQHAGRFPEAYEDVVALPGVGRYTAGAILSIAFGARLPAVDANAVRVLARVLGTRGDVARGDAKRRIEGFGATAVPADRPGDYNQALMELGALVCLPRHPRCANCPITGLCQAERRGEQSTIPKPRARAQARAVRTAAGVVWRDDRVLLAKRPPSGVWAGLWGFPSAELRGTTSPETAVRRLVRHEFGLDVRAKQRVVAFRHAIMNRRVELTAVACEVVGGRVPARRTPRAVWVPLGELDGYPLPAPHRRIARALERTQGRV